MGILAKSRMTPSCSMLLRASVPISVATPRLDSWKVLHRMMTTMWNTLSTAFVRMTHMLSLRIDPRASGSMSRGSRFDWSFVSWRNISTIG